MGQSRVALCKVVTGDEMRQKGELGLGHRSSSIFLLLCFVVSSGQAGASAIGWGAGAVSQVRQTLIAAAAANTQWFPYTGTDCATAAATATLQPGWPGAPVAGIGATTPAPGALSICLRQKILFRGGRWSPWRQVSGNVGAAWTPNWGSVGGAGNPGIDITAVVEDAILNAEDAVGLDLRV